MAAVAKKEEIDPYLLEFFGQDAEAELLLTGIPSVPKGGEPNPFAEIVLSNEEEFGLPPPVPGS